MRFLTNCISACFHILYKFIELTRLHSRFLPTCPSRWCRRNPQRHQCQEEPGEEENISSPCNTGSCRLLRRCQCQGEREPWQQHLPVPDQDLPGWHVDGFLLDGATISARVIVSIPGFGTNRWNKNEYFLWLMMAG